jgi:hemerythrin superfamily protein
MTIFETVKAKSREYTFSRETEKSQLLRLVIGTVQQNGDESDTAVEAVIRKIIKGNDETLDIVKEDDQLVQENILLKSFLPESLSVEDVLGIIKDLGVQETNVGKLTGIVIKHIKTTGKNVQGSTVKEAVSKFLE